MAFELTAADKQSALWRDLEAHMTERLSALRLLNDGDKTPDETAKLRGQIAEVKAFLSLGKERARPT